MTNTHCKGLEYKNAKEKAESAKKLFEDVFEFDEVRAFTDLTKEEIIDKLTDLKKEAKDYEDANPTQIGKSQPILAIAVVWIGHKLQGSWYAPHKDILANLISKDTANVDNN